MAGATTVTVGKGLNSLPWELFVPAMFALSIGCIYFAVTIKGKTKVLNIFGFCAAIMTFLMGLESLAINTGMFPECLPFLKPIIFSVVGVTMILAFWYS